MTESESIRLSNKTAGLLAAGLSLVVHLVLILLVSRATIVIHTLPRVFQVQTIIIPPSKTIRLPPDVDWSELTPPSTLDWTLERPDRVSTRIRETPGEPEGPSGGGSGQGPPESAAEGGSSLRGDPAASGLYSPEALSESFAGRLASRYSSPSKPDSGLTISLAPGRPGVRGGSSGPVGDLRARAATVGSGTGTGRSGPAGSSTPRAAFGKASVFISRQVVDMGPWAEAMMARILSKWMLPDTHQVVRRSQVAISAVIEKSGEISRVDILSGTSSSFLDIAALEALKLSSPLHRLPDGFPDATLEALFLFTYEN